MAIATEHGTCRHCGEKIALRVYAGGSDPCGVKLWTAGDGHYPGDQRVCEENILDDGFSWGEHTP